MGLMGIRFEDDMNINDVIEDVLDLLVHEQTEIENFPIDIRYAHQVERVIPGKVSRIKRKFVEVLASLHRTRADGSRGLEHPFTVVNDPRPEIGKTRIDKILAPT